MKRHNSLLNRIVAIAVWILIWQLVAMIVHNKVLLAGPVETVRALINLSGNGDFWQSITNTVTHILGGFLIGTVQRVWQETFLSPLYPS